MKKILLSSLIACVTAFGLNAQIQNYNVGDVVADFTVTDTDGNSHTLSDYTNAGKWVILDFFFIACPPCQASAPIFSELHEKYGCNSADLVCISVSIDTDNDAQVMAFEASYGGTFSHAPAASGDGGGGNVVAAFGVNAFPTFGLIGADMTLKLADIWPISSVSDFETAFASVNFSPTPTTCGIAATSELTLTNAQIFPNPTAGNVSIRFNNAVSSNVTIEVSNLLGQVVYSSIETTVTGSNSFNLNLSNLNDGQYIVKIGDGKSQTISKIQISK